MLTNKLIDGIIKEPLGGAHKDIAAASAELKKTIIEQLKELNNLSPELRISERIEKFSSMGVVNDL